MKKRTPKKRIPLVTQNELRQFIRNVKRLIKQDQPTKEDSKYLPVWNPNHGQFPPLLELPGIGSFGAYQTGPSIDLGFLPPFSLSGVPKPPQATSDSDKHRPESKPNAIKRSWKNRFRWNSWGRN